VPVEWKKGQWPVVNGGQPVDTLVQARTLPLVPVSPKPSYYDFNAPFGPEWVYIQNPLVQNYQKVDGRLRLMASRSSLTHNDRPTFIGRRQESAAVLVETHLNFSESAIGDEAGLSVYQINDGHTDFCLQGMKGRMVVAVKTQLKTIGSTLFSEEIDGYEAWLRITSDGELYCFEYSLDGQHYKRCYEMACSLMSTEVVGGFTGVVLGMYCSQKGNDGATYADFDYFKYEEK
jgi:alpha-N-arabinofuranosidase